ncbi:MAG: glycosyltransferase family 2 protein [Leptospirillia bacterium]
MSSPQEASPERRPLSVFVLAFNQEHKIRPALESILWADEVILVDSGSTDRTAEIARELGVSVVQVPFSGFGALRNEAVSRCRFDWIFSLDSDERMTEEAKEEILSILASPQPLDAYLVPRKNYFLGKWIRHSDWYPDFRQPQLFRKGTFVYSSDLVHESFMMNPEKKLGKMSSAIVQIPFFDLGEMIGKMNRYSGLGSEKLASRGQRSSILSGLMHGVWAFFRHFILKKGFLDGGPGFIIALYNFESSFYKYAKLYEKTSQDPSSPCR